MSQKFEYKVVSIITNTSDTIAIWASNGWRVVAAITAKYPQFTNQLVFEKPLKTEQNEFSAGPFVSDEVKAKAGRIIEEELMRGTLDVSVVVDSLAASGCLISYFVEDESSTR